MKQLMPELPPDYDRARVIERPDGFYWQSLDARRQYGPFATLMEAVQDMAATDDDEQLEPGESLQEAQAEIGMADWIDPDTGEPAEEDGLRTEQY